MVDYRKLGKALADFSVHDLEGKIKSDFSEVSLDSKALIITGFINRQIEKDNIHSVIASTNRSGEIFYLDKEKDCTALESVLLKFVDVWQKERDIKYAQENYFHKFFSGLSSKDISNIYEKLAFRSWTKFPEFAVRYLRKKEDRARLAKEIIDTHPKIAYECLDSVEDYSRHGLLALKMAHEDPELAFDILKERGEKDQLVDFIAYMFDIEEKFLEDEAKEEDEDIDDEDEDMDDFEEDESAEYVRDLNILFKAAAFFKEKFSDDPNCDEYYEKARDYLFMSDESYKIEEALKDAGDKEGLLLFAKRLYSRDKDSNIEAIEIFNGLGYTGEEYEKAVFNLVKRWPSSVNDWQEKLKERLKLDKKLIVECAQKGYDAEKDKADQADFIELIEHYGEREKLMLAFNFYSDRDNKFYDIKKAYNLLIKSGLADEKKKAEIREILFKEKGTKIDWWTFDNDINGAKAFIDCFCEQDPKEMYELAIRIKDEKRIIKTRDLLMKQITDPSRLYSLFKYEKDQEGRDMVLESVSKDVGIEIGDLKKYIAKKEN